MSTIATRAWKNLYQQNRAIILSLTAVGLLLTIILAGKPRQEQFKIIESNWTIQYQQEQLVRVSEGHSDWKGSVIHRCDGAGADIKCTPPVIPMPVGGQHRLEEYFYGVVTTLHNDTKHEIKFDDWQRYKQEVERGYVLHACWWFVCLN